MEFIVNSAFFVLNLIYGLLKLLPQGNKVVFISRQHDYPNVDFKMITEQLKKDDNSIQTVFLCKMIHPGIINKIRYGLHMFEQMYHIATAKVVVLDTYCILASVLHHRSNLKVIQIWHANGCLKKFGYSILDKGEGSSSKTAKLFHMHEGYTHVLTSSKATIKGFAEAFNTDESKLLVAPLPRMDLLRDINHINEVKSKVLQAHPELANGKINVLYVPTFRKDDSFFNQQLQSLISNFDYENFNLIISLHPLSKAEVNDDRVVVDKKFASMDFGCVADCCITDYSAVVYEIGMLNKEIYYWCYDRNDYVNNRDFYTPYDELPGPKCYTVNELLTAISNHECNKEDVKKFIDKYIEPSIDNYTKHICQIITK